MRKEEAQDAAEKVRIVRKRGRRGGLDGVRHESALYDELGSTQAWQGTLDESVWMAIEDVCKSRRCTEYAYQDSKSLSPTSLLPFLGDGGEGGGRRRRGDA